VHLRKEAPNDVPLGTTIAAVGELPEMDAKMGEAVVKQAFEFWIGPEIERRRAVGELPEDYALRGAQVLFGIDEGPPEVRLNEEVKAVAVVTAARAIAKGKAVSESDLAGYEEIVLTEQDPDAGHITIVSHRGGWTLAFDFRRNASRIAEHSEVAGQFLETARWAREQGYWRVFVDNLFSATELMARGMLIWQPDRSLLIAKTNRLIKVRFNWERKHENVDGRFVDLLNRLGELREPARYLSGAIALTHGEMGVNARGRRGDARCARRGDAWPGEPRRVRRPVGLDAEGGRAQEPDEAGDADRPRAEVLLFPYLPIGSDRLEVGPWELIPRRAFDDGDATAPWVAESVRGLLDLYKVSTTTIGMGTIVRHRDGKVGDTVDRDAMRPLRRTVVAAVLGGNPEVTEPGRQQGLSVATSDNALLFGHSVGPEGWVTVQYGLMVETTVGGIQIGTEHGVIHAPNELHVPLTGPNIDKDYLPPLWRVVVGDSGEERRVGRAIDWLDLSWRNTLSISEEMRIMSLKAGFEVLLDSDDVVELRDRLSALLDPPDVARPEREWVSRAGNPRRAELSDLQWWFTQFTFLRNAIAHGDELADEQFDFDSKRHLWLGEARLRQALKATVARLSGEEDILVDPLERAYRRAMRVLGEEP
jgi:hypothetical protein